MNWNDFFISFKCFCYESFFIMDFKCVFLNLNLMVTWIFCFTENETIIEFCPGITSTPQKHKPSINDLTFAVSPIPGKKTMIDFSRAEFSSKPTHEPLANEQTFTIFPKTRQVDWFLTQSHSSWNEWISC